MNELENIKNDGTDTSLSDNTQSANSDTTQSMESLSKDLSDKRISCFMTTKRLIRNALKSMLF